MKPMSFFALACALLMFSESYASAATHPAHHHSRHHGAAGRDRANFDQSGTRGRMGLGANPRHPEGPGNVNIGR